MINIFDENHEVLRERFFAHFIESLESCRSQERIVIGLSGGSSLSLFYREIGNRFSSIDPDLRNRIYFCFLDERVVGFENEASNYRLVSGLFLSDLVSKGLLPQDRILVPDFSLDQYEREYFSRVQKIDIGLFGVGEDGHICSLFPHHPFLREEEYGYLRIHDSPKPPPVRITVSRTMLCDIRSAFICFMGEAKRGALERFSDAGTDPVVCPAKLILDCRKVVLVSDLV